MDADEARALANREAAKRTARSQLIQIEAAAKRGEFEIYAGSMDNGEANALKLLGFRLTSEGTRVRISWAAV